MKSITQQSNTSFQISPRRRLLPHAKVDFNIAKDQCTDNITFKLGGAGLKCYKYVPYGPVGVTIPYLLRGGEEDRNGIVKELSKRA
ncbi:hypothetical protein HK098_004125 [Nowakowskiella sp. JEL0407]|nr:hypothetical protein HK098_004125 [Nowakowskiella sp. JEL0407]